MKTITLICTVLIGLLARAAAGPLTVVENGKSDYSIYCEAQAPTTVKRAATELQRVIQKATGTKLPIKNAPAPPMICLGVNDSAHAAGVDKDLPEFGFRLMAKETDIFILGQDSADGQEPWAGMPLQGTWQGACTFLEKFANVRWLMPGDLGEDIPKLEKLVVEDLNIQETPSIKYRYTFGLNDTRADVNDWLLHNKVNIKRGNAGLNYSHSFNSYPPTEVLLQHPEVMALRKDGTRMPVPPKNGKAMYCLSNPLIYELYANALIEAFDKNPKLYSMSMGPDEGPPFCECPECQRAAMALTQEWKDLGVINNPQRTPVVLKFYNEVAKRVRAKHPNRVLGGAIYQDYLVPLPEPIKMEPNIVFGLGVNSGYGFKFYQPRRQALMQKLFEEWSRYGTPLAFNDYNTWLRNWFGFPVPPGLSLLKWGYPALKKNHVDYVQYNGMDAWGYAAANSYLVAKLMWNADANVDALCNEFLTRAYGPEAGPLVARIYEMVDEKLQAHINSKPYPDHEIDYNLAQATYGPIWLDIERLYLEATGKTQTDAQRRRLEMFGDNLVQGHFHMWKAKLLPEADAENSPFFKGTDDFEDFIAQKEKGLSINYVSAWVKHYGYTDMPVLRPGWRPK